MPTTTAEQFDLNLLTALEVLLSEGSVTRAAARLGITQSGMSHKLRRLRDAFDDPLVVQTGKSLVATPRADAVVAPLRRGLAELRNVIATPRSFDPRTADRTFKVMCSDYAEFSILPLVLQWIGEQAPGVRMDIRHPTADAAEQLEEGEVDLVMGGPLPPRGGLIQKRVASESFKCLLRAGHPDVGDTIDVDTFTSIPHLLTSAGKGPSPVAEALARIGRSRTVMMRIPNFAGGPFIVARSNLLWTTGRSIARAAAKFLPVRVYDLPISLPVFGVYMTWHERNSSDEGHRFVRSISQEATRAVIDDGVSL